MSDEKFFLEKGKATKELFRGQQRGQNSKVTIQIQKVKFRGYHSNTNLWCKTYIYKINLVIDNTFKDTYLWFKLHLVKETKQQISKKKNSNNIHRSGQIL